MGYREVWIWMDATTMYAPASSRNRRCRRRTAIPMWQLNLLGRFPCRTTRNRASLQRPSGCWLPGHISKLDQRLIGGSKHQRRVVSHCQPMCTDFNVAFQRFRLHTRSNTDVDTAAGGPRYNLFDQLLNLGMAPPADVAHGSGEVCRSDHDRRKTRDCESVIEVARRNRVSICTMMMINSLAVRQKSASSIRP